MQYGINRLQLTEQRRCQQQGDPSFHIPLSPFHKKTGGPSVSDGLLLFSSIVSVLALGTDMRSDLDIFFFDVVEQQPAIA